MKDVGVIVIGRNEGRRLRLGLESVLSEAEHVIYVDSGSADGSADLAESIGVPVVRLSDGPFTAARGRQVGLEVILQGIQVL